MADDDPKSNDLDISQEQIDEIHVTHAAVGQGISTWASMEGTIVELAALLIGTSPEKAGLIFYSIANFNVWLTLVSELFASSPSVSKLRAIWNKEAEDLRTMNDTRVRLAHHTIWGYGVEAALSAALRPHRYDIRTKSKKHQPLTAEEIVVFGRKTFDKHMRLARLADALETAINAKATGGKEPSSDTFYEQELDLGPPKGPPERR